MGLESNDYYYIKPHCLFVSQDLPYLPLELQEFFQETIKPLLERSPRDCLKKLQNHVLVRDPLIGYYSIELELQDIDYRLIYKIDDGNRRVEIFSFDEHRPAYHKAEERVRRSTGYRRHPYC